MEEVRAGPAFLGHVPMGIGISGCVNTSLSRRIEREQSETSTPAHCLRLGINKSIALGYGCRHGNQRPIRALSHSPSLSLSLPSSSPPRCVSLPLFSSFSSSYPPPLRPSQFISVPLRSSNIRTLLYSSSSLYPLLSSYATSILLLRYRPVFLLYPTGLLKNSG